MRTLQFARGPRRYILALDVDLFDEVVITRHWYGDDSRYHGRRQELFERLDVAAERFDAVTRYLLGRGYLLSGDQLAGGVTGGRATYQPV